MLKKVRIAESHGQVCGHFTGFSFFIGMMDARCSNKTHLDCLNALFTDPQPLKQQLSHEP